MMGELHLNPGDAQAWTRRQFLHTGLAMTSAALTVPQFLSRSASALPLPAMGCSSISGADEGKVLVVVQLSGGNDGLNTVVPYRDDNYYRVRPRIGIPGADVLGIDGDMGLHPALSGIKGLYDDGLATVVQGVGYPNPNRSHFKSMDIWQTADAEGSGDGWLGRYIDSQCVGYGAGESGTAETTQPEPPIAVGREAPLALVGRRMSPVAFENADMFKWRGAEVHEALAEPYDQLTMRGPDAAEHGSNAAFLMRTAMEARVSSDTIRQAVSRQPATRYPNSQLARELSMVASMIGAGLKTRVYYVSHGSFDTHAAQGGSQGRHAQLLTQWGDAIRAFYADLKQQQLDSQVLTMSFSEFGRRVGQNASNGTDHGTAAPMFMFGPMVKPGVFGKQPSLTNLDNGDLKFGLDFRTVYADVLKNWLDAPVESVLGKRFDPTKLIRV